ncbi:hypothetical protein ACWD6N_12335, partial [Micromonospora sp. NPDC005163]
APAEWARPSAPHFISRTSSTATYPNLVEITSVVTEWISQTQAERARAEADLHTHSSNRPRRMSRTEIKDLVQALGDIATVLRDADPTDKAEVYQQLGLRLTYQPETQTVRAAVDLSAHRGAMVCVRGATSTRNP